MKSDGRATRIIATIGPACADRGTIRRMVAAGIDVARLNMSHGDAASHRRAAQLVRAAAREAGRPVGLMADLQGPKLRLGRFDAPVPLRRGRRLVLTTRASEADPAQGVLPVDYRQLPLEAEPGHELLLSDGLVRLRVEKVTGHRVVCSVLEGDLLTPRTGLFLPQARAVRSPLSAKDRRDLALAVSLKADFIALSFVRRAHDVVEARRLVERAGGTQQLVAKIETRAAVAGLDEIIVASDALLVARGDLGVELPPERVPVEQKLMLNAAAAAGKPTIVATQMLESMRHATRPTRAEASDVANAVLDGAWAVMLTAETASGEHPVEAVRMMDRIAREAEQLQRAPRRLPVRGALGVSEGIAEAGVALALEIGAAALVALTRSGATARQVARFPLRLPFFAYTPTPATLGQLTLVRGAVPRRLAERASLEAALGAIDRDLKRCRALARGDLIVVLGGAPSEPGGTTSRLAVHKIR